MPNRPGVTVRTQHVFGIAHELAARLGHSDISPVHLLLAIIREGRSPAVVVLYQRGVHLDVLEEELENRLPASREPYPATDTWTADDLALLRNAAREASELGHQYQGCEHILLAVLRDSESVASKVLAHNNVHFADARTEVLRLLGPPHSDGADRASLRI